MHTQTTAANMLLQGALTLFILWGSASCVRYQADFNMMGITGWIRFDPTYQRATVNFTETRKCQSFNISLTTFPVMYGHFASPCQKSHIGESVFTFVVNQPQITVNVSTLFVQHLSLDALSVLVDTCNGIRVCAALTPDSQVRTLQARFFHPVAGNVYIRQLTGEAGARVLSNLRNVNQTTTFSNVTIYVSQSSATNCSTLIGSLDPKSLTKLGVLSLGSPLEAVKSRLEISTFNSDVRFAVLSLTYIGYICAEIRNISDKTVSAVLNMQGIKGYFSFQQMSPFDLTTITVNLTNLNRRVGPYHVHQFPLLQMRSSSDSSCSNNNVGGHWNPFNVNVQAPAYPPPKGSTHDFFEVGDLSSRHGSLENTSNFQATLKDWNLPLFGWNSIVGRSVVIHLPNGTRFACSSINYPGEVTVAKAVFRGPVVGTVLFSQLTDEPYSDVSIFVDLSYGQLSARSTVNHSWHIHNYPISTETDSDVGCCLSTGGHWNPYNINSERESAYTVNCSPGSPFACEVGDISGKHKTLDLQSDIGSVATKNFFTDTTSWILGMIGRSLVIHGPDQTATRIACANLTLYRFPSARSKLWFGSESSEGQIRFSQASPQGPTILDIFFTGLNSKAGGYHIHMLPIKSTQEPCSDSNIMGHFNPFSVNATLSPAPGNGTVDQYEIGDISGKFGDLTGQNIFQNQYRDGNMPLSGPNSIIGRSVVIHYTNSSRMRCTDISAENSKDGYWVTAKAKFSNAVTGTVVMSQQTFPDGSYDDIMIEVDLQSSNFSWASWYIADDPVYPNGSCPEDDIYNPFNMTNMNNCSQARALSCMVGDLTGRYGPIRLSKRQLFTDTLLQLAGDFTVIQRALVLRVNSTTAVCADIYTESPSAQQIFPKIYPFNRYEFRKRVADVLNIPISRISILPGSPSLLSNGTCQQVDFVVSGKVTIEDLNSIRNSVKMGSFKESKQCPRTGNTGLMLVPRWTSVFALTAAVCLLRL